jgi:hypothetical protein
LAGAEKVEVGHVRAAHQGGHRRMIFRSVLRCLLNLAAAVALSACAHITRTDQGYEGVPAKEFIYLNTRYLARDVPASRRLLLSRATDGDALIGIGRHRYSKHDIDAAVRTYFSEVGKQGCLVQHISEITSDSWEVSYVCS